MKKGRLNTIINLTILTSLVASSLLTPLSASASHIIPTSGAHVRTESHAPMLQSSNLLDPDFDGIPTSLEEAGWSHEGGGPYVTNPNNPDTDGDGLSDGTEHLYQTNPNDDKSPGLYVEYRSEYQTKKYYPWQQAGALQADRFIVHTELADETKHDIIVRRGTTLQLGGPIGATLEIIKADSGLTDLQPLSHICSGGGWAIPIPEDAKTGTYTLRATDGGWQEELTLYVIFELDQPDGGELTQTHVDSFSYNDDLDNHRDSIAIYWDTSYDTNSTTYWDHDVYGWGIGWETDFTEQYVFEDRVMTALQGFDDKRAAANALRNYTDTIVDFNAYAFPNSSQDALLNSYYDYNSRDGEYIHENDTHTPNGTIDADCNGNASVYTTFLRSAGLTARPMAVDWGWAHYDTATEVWVDGQWLVQRAYYPWGNDLHTRQQWGQSKYWNQHDLILVAGPEWQFDQINIDYQGAEVEDYFTRRKYENGSWVEYPHQYGTAVSEIKRWDWVETPTLAYWGRQPATLIGDCRDNGCEGGSIGVLSSEPPVGPETHPEIARLTQILSDYGVDQDNDGRYDQLVVEAEIEVSQVDEYYIDARLNDLDPETRLGGQIDSIAGAGLQQTLEPGLNVVSLVFDGRMIGQKNASGPYVIDWLRITNEPNIEPHLSEGLIDEQQPNYITANYDAQEFEGQDAAFTESYNHNAQDTNGDGFIDQVVVNTGITINEAGSYRVEGNLTTVAGEVVAETSWQGSDGQVSLVFDALLARPDSYYLRDLTLYGPSGLIETIGRTRAYDLSNYAYDLGSFYSSGIQTQSSGALSISGITTTDTDNDSDFDSLDVSISTFVAVAGQYKIEAWLESANGALIALRSQEEAWSAGIHNATLSFDGASINAFGANGPYKVIDLKLLGWNGFFYTTLLSEGEPDNGTTNAYTFDQFDGSSHLVMADGIEGDAATYWNLTETSWSVTDEAAHTPAQAWTDSPNANYSAGETKLTANKIDVSNVAIPTVSFWTCYAIDDGQSDVGEFQVRGDDGNWITLDSYTGANNNWQQKQFFVSEIAGAEDFDFRFLLDTNGANDNGWFVDDVTVSLDYDVDDDGLSNVVENAEQGTDTDDDDIPDYLDADSDNDTIPDSVEGSIDTDEDDIPNYRDTDSDNDTIPDQIEGTGDIDGDGIPNYLDPDSDNDNISDEVEGTVDTDEDGKPNYLDEDSDGDQIPDSVEGNEDGIDGDGIPNYLDEDSDGDGILDEEETAGDADADGMKNFEDIDSDGDGISDTAEGTEDTDNDGRANYLDIDSDNDGIPDAVEGTNDEDDNGVADYLERNGVQIFLPILIK